MIRRSPHNPILTYKDVPYPTALAYNGSVIWWEGRYVMLFRNDHGSFERQELNTQTDIGLAFSDDGLNWKVEPEIVWKASGDEQKAVYDPRLQIVEGRPVVTVAIDTSHGLRAGIATTEDFRTFDLRYTSLPDNRDLVLFPDRIGGLYVRLDRPMLGFGPDAENGFSIWLSRSPDLRYWGDHELVLGQDQVPYANDRIGAGSPPIRTEKGWLTLIHAVDEVPDQGKNGWEDEWTRVYKAAALLLDLENPAKVVGLSRSPLFSPEASYETKGGYRNDVVFPTSLLVDGDEATVYYAAADSWMCVAKASLAEILATCDPLPST